MHLTSKKSNNHTVHRIRQQVSKMEKDVWHTIHIYYITMATR